MKNLLHKLPVRWIFRLAVAVVASYVTGLSLGWCILAYIGVIFLIRLSLNMLLVIIGFTLIVCVFIALYLGLLSI